MHKYRKEGWVRKVVDSYPKKWSTSYKDFGYFHNPKQVPGWVGWKDGLDYDKKFPLTARELPSDAARRSHQDFGVTPQKRKLKDGLYYSTDYDGNMTTDLNQFHSKTSPRNRANAGVRLSPLPRARKTMYDNRTQSNLVLDGHGTPNPWDHTNYVKYYPRSPRQAGVNEKFFGFQYRVPWKPSSSLSPRLY